MRASAVRLAIATAIMAISADDKASARDRFVWLKTGQRTPGSSVDRTFTLTLTAQPQRAESAAISTFVSEYKLAVFYSSTPGLGSADGGVEDRIAKDSERIHAAADRLHEQDADINVCMVTPIGVIEIEGEIRAEWSMVVNYRLTQGVENGTA